ncbi:MAG: magnesium transporter CorA family protein [Pseudomonadota bacterium]
MLTVYGVKDEALLPLKSATAEDIRRAVWIDLLNLTKDEENLVEETLHISVPTREEMQEIEISNRLYTENGATYMTITAVTRLGSDEPEFSPVTFILTAEKLVTVRYAEPYSFQMFAARAKSPDSGYYCGQVVFIGLIEAMINRLADSVELTGMDVDSISREIFSKAQPDKKPDFQDILQRLGRKGDLSSKILATLTSLARMEHFFHETIDFSHLPAAKEIDSRMVAIGKDITSLADNVGYLGNKISFLLDATLGFISIDQNNVFKVFSIVTVCLMPPTLIGAIYGMNFKILPELEWAWGYPFALVLMLVSGVLPLLYFRRKGWL